MTREAKCYKLIAALLVLLLTAMACGPRASSTTGEATPLPTAPPPTRPAAASRCGDGLCDEVERADPGLCPQDCQATETPARPTAATTSAPAGKCGDGVCDGPEDAQNCPQDCQATQPSLTGGEACQNPNPRRAVISELLDWQNWLPDGGFEQGNAEVVLADSPQGGLKRGRAERSQQAAHTGSWGYAITTGAGEGLVFSVKFFMEKGENTRFSFWARSAGGEVSLKPSVESLNFSDTAKPTQAYGSATAYTVGTDWTQVMFETKFSQVDAYALFSLTIPPDTTLYLDDMAIEFPIWEMAEYSGVHRTVGGIPVPNEPVAPVHINFLIHIEDPASLQLNEAFFQTKTAVFRELAAIFHAHGGSLTIQPEEDWVMASDQFAPGLLKQFVQDYDVVFSTHTHGPHCRDDQGRLRSNADCNANRDTPGWDQSINDYEYPYVIEYVRNLRDVITAASGVQVTDHNGNWEFDQASRFAEIPMYTWSGYKAWRTQETYDYLINNPWRPTEANADADIEAFLTHDPNTPIVYIPGWGQAITRYAERVQDRIRPMLSQFIYYADPERVNTFYAVFHVDHFYSRTGDPNYIAYNPATASFTYSDEFRQHLAYWDDMLTQVIDPLVQEGYLEWTSLPEIGELYREWEADCGATAATAPSPATPPSPARAPAPVTSSAPGYEPPIDIFLVLHIDPDMDLATNSFRVTPEVYQRTRDEIDWLMTEAEKHDLRFTSLYNGWYPKEALEKGDVTQFQELLAAGHEIGSHAHRLTYDADQDLWIGRVTELDKYGRPNYDAALARQTWYDADHYVDAVLTELGAPGQNETMCAVAFKCSDQGQLMDEFGFTIAAGGRADLGVLYFGHQVWNPWRSGSSDLSGHELEEDLNASFISLDHLAQVGIRGGVHGADLSIPQMERRFLMLYVEWLSRERRGAEERVWTFGFVYHPEDGDIFNAELAEFLSWLDANFIGKESPQGNVIARYATVGEIAKQYYAWEAAHPGASSFSYVRDDPYPYTYAVVPTILDAADYEAQVDMGQGVVCFRFSKDGQPIYMLWSSAGQRMADLSAEVRGQVRVIDAAGKESMQDAAALQLTEEPMFVQPLK
jgi:hypothetical protein